MSDARKAAEEALATMNGVLLAWGPQPPMSKAATLCYAISVGTRAIEALLAEQEGAWDAIDLASLPVHFIALLPRGRVFMHPDTPRSGVRDPWPPLAPSFTNWTGAATKPDAPAPSPARDEAAHLRDQIAARESTIATLNESLARAITASDEVREAAEEMRTSLRMRESQSWCGSVACDEVRSKGWALLAALAARPAVAESDEVREAAEVRYATRPSRDDRRVPYCDEQCPQHDGKRCRLMGVQPSSICEPEVLNLIAAIAARSTTKGGLP